MNHFYNFTICHLIFYIITVLQPIVMWLWWVLRHFWTNLMIEKISIFWKNIDWEDNDINKCLGIINTYINCTSKNDLYISLIYQTLNIQSERKKLRFYKI